MRIGKWVLAGLLGVLVLAGCSTQGGVPQADDGPEVAVADELALDSALLADLSNTGAMSTEGLVAEGWGWGLPRPVVRALRHWGVYLPRPGANGSCNIAITSGADNDGDGVLGGFAATFDCSGETPGGRSFVLKGTVTYGDDDDGDPAVISRTLAFDNFYVKVEGAGKNGIYTKRERTLDGTVQLAPERDPNGGLTSVTLTKKLTLTVVTTRGEVTHTTATTFDRTSTYTPDDPANPRLAGTLALSGTVTVDRDGDQAVLSVNTDPDNPLHFSRDCADAHPDVPGFDRGSVVYEKRVNGEVQKRITVTFIACGEMQVQVEF